MEQGKLENIRHSLARLLGASVMEFYPDTKLAIGPAIDNGFYYDIEVSGKISDTDLPRIETEMRKILKTWDKFEMMDEDSKSAKTHYVGNKFKIELIEDLIAKG